MKQSTICAIATPIGIGSVSIVRLSGSQAKHIAGKLFVSKQTITPRKAILGNFTYNGISDKCILIYFQAPNSFTGEDIVEFQCHGGVYLTQTILQACIEQGAELASKGEFSMRAFISGKLSLDEAEGIVDTINAESISEVLVGQRLQKGALKKQIDKVQSGLTALLANINLSLDYPEHDDEAHVLTQISQHLLPAQQLLQTLLETEQTGKIIRSGIQVAIIGKPNVGKSSVLNALIGTDRAIVSDIAGTTRDIVCETIIHNGFKIKFSDTAGIRDSTDTIEQMGIQKSKSEAMQADIVLAVFDASQKMDSYDKQILSIAQQKKHIIIFNKSDQPTQLELLPNALLVSAKTGKNINNIKQQIVLQTISQNIDISGEAVVNTRQAELLKQAVAQIKEILKTYKQQTLDIIAFQIKDLWNTIGGITGKTDNEDIIDEIFSKFCLGK